MRFHLTALAFLWVGLTPSSSFLTATKCTSIPSSSTVLFSAASYDETNYNYNYNPFEVAEGDQLQRPGGMSYDNFVNAPQYPSPPNTSTSTSTRRNQPFLPNNNMNMDHDYIPPRPPAMNWQRASQERQRMRQTPQLSQRQPRDNYYSYSNNPPTSSDYYQAYQQNEQYFEDNSPSQSQPPQYNNVWQTEPPRGYAPPDSVPTRDNDNNNRLGLLQGIQQLEERAMAAAAAAAQNEQRDPSTTLESDAATRKFLEESFGKLEQSFNLRLDRNRDIYDDLWDEANRIYQNLQRMDNHQKLDYLVAPFRNFMNKIQDQRMLPSATHNHNNNFNNKNMNNRNNRNMPNQAFNNNNNNNNMNIPNQGFNRMQQNSPNNNFNKNNNLQNPMMNGMPNQGINTRNTFQNDNNNNNNNFGSNNAGFNAPMSSNQGPPNPMQQPNNAMPNRPATNTFRQNHNFSQPNPNGFGGNRNGNGNDNGNNMPNSFAPTPNAFPKTNMPNTNTNTNTNSFTRQTEGLKDGGAWQ